MLRSAWIVYDTLRISAMTIARSLRGKLDRETVDAYLKSWGADVVKHARLTLDIRGAEQVDWSQAYVVMSNHQSLLDIPALALAVPGSLRFVAKKELFRIPVWGPAMRAAGIIEIDRGHRQKAIASLGEAAEAVRSGVNIWIAPEGTRSKTGELGALKKGGFALAADTGARILPVVIRGTRDALPKGSRLTLRPAHATVTFGKAIEVAGRPRPEVMAEVEALFRKGLAD